MSLPNLLADVEAVAGTAAALRLARMRGGTKITISARPGSALVKILGQTAATALVARVGGGEVMVPMAHGRGQKGRQAAAAMMISKGAKVREVALACDIHERTAWRVKRRMDGAIDPDQPDLFSPDEGEEQADT